MKIPRDISADDLIKALRKSYGYEIARQKGSHIRIHSPQNGGHSITIPAHDPIVIGTLKGILDDVAAHHILSRDEVMETLFG